MSNNAYKTIKIGGVDYSEYLPFPFVINEAQNQQLDYAVADLVGMDRSEPFRPFEQVELANRPYILVSDDVTAVFGTGRYKHSLSLMEQTKELERVIMGAKAFTNPVVKDYSKGQTDLYGNIMRMTTDPTDELISLEKYGGPLSLRQSNVQTAPKIGKTFPIYYDLFEKDDEVLSPNFVYISVYHSKTGAVKWTSQDKCIIERKNKVYEEKYFDLAGLPHGKILDTINAEKEGFGEYAILYRYLYGAGPTFYLTYFNVLENPTPVQPYTVAEVVRTLLTCAETIRRYDTPRYLLAFRDTKQKKRFDQEAPEFKFANGRSLWENLLEVGQYMHCIPRLIGNTIYFDDLGGVKRAYLGKGHQVGATYSANAGDYTGGLDSIVSNLINSEDIGDGTITEPFAGGWLTLRAEEDQARIGEDTGIIYTNAGGIELVLNVRASFEAGGKVYQSVDITPYIFEKSEYDLLSSFSGSYPTSKTYALYYEQGQPNIQGLWYKAEDTGSDIFNALQNYSIVNVLSAASGVGINILNSVDYRKMSFKVSYIPTINARVRQFKPTAHNTGNVMAYNQSANKLSARAFGENLMGQLAMLSNPTKGVDYVFRDLQDVPKAGDLFDDVYYISEVSTRVYRDFAVAQIKLSANYNELGAYAEINNEIRQFEIPAAEERYINVDEFAVINTEQGGADPECMAGGLYVREKILNTFEQYDKGANLDQAVIKTYSQSGEWLSSLSLPLNSLAIGSSLYFGFRFPDNFSAGSKSVDAGKGAKYRYQEYVPYGDTDYARMAYMFLSLATGGEMGAADFAAADRLPEVTPGSGQVGQYVIGTGINWLSIQKDSADSCNVSYQLHFMADDPSLIIGSGFAKHCPLIRSRDPSGVAFAFFFSHRISNLTGTINVTDAVGYTPIKVLRDSSDEPYLAIESIPQSYSSWAVIKGGQFLLGQNKSSVPKKLYIKIKRRINK